MKLRNDSNNGVDGNRKLLPASNAVRLCVLTLPLLLMGIAGAASADEFHVVLRYSCEPANDSLQLEYDGAYNEAGKRLLENGGSNDWDISKWNVAFNEARDFVHMTAVQRTCHLSDGDYSIEAGRVPGNYDVQGRCGAWSTAWVRICKNETQLAFIHFESDCLMAEPIVKTIKVRARGHSEITKVPPDEFYK